MFALTVDPKVSHSAALEHANEPNGDPDSILVQTLLVGICGTDREIVKGEYGWSPPGRSRMILGHEMMGRVLEAPAASGFSAGDLVAAVVRPPESVAASLRPRTART